MLILPFSVEGQVSRRDERYLFFNPHPPTWGLFGPQTTYCSIYFPQCNKSISALLDMRCRELA